MPHHALRLSSIPLRLSALGVLVPTLFFAFYLSVSPQLHERLHPDAKQAQHECGVTLIAAGNCHHGAIAPVVITPVRPNEFSRISPLTPIWVQSPFLGARIFEHAPPQNS
jgi:hypothetical protein